MDRTWVLLLGFVAALFPFGGSAQQPAFDGMEPLRASIAQLADPQSAATQAEDAAAIMASVGLSLARMDLPIPPAFDFVPDGKAVVELVDIRLLLAQIAVQTGARDHLALVRAQGARDHDVILLRGGLATLTDLVVLTRGTPAQAFVQRSADGIVLTRPLAIWGDAGLMVYGRDRLILDRPSGSFLANLGWLNLSGGAIAGAGPANGAEPSFRPFVLTAGLGRITARAAAFAELGFGDAPVFGGVAVANSGLITPRDVSVVSQSSLTNVGGLSLIGTANAQIDRNRISGSTRTAILVSGGQGTIISGNRLSRLSGAQAIRVSNAAAAVRIDGNLVSGAARTGILIDGDSRGVTVTGNLVTGQSGTGISVQKAECTDIGSNLVVANGGSGIGLSGTVDAALLNNALLLNAGSGVMLRDQGPAAQTWVQGNVFAANRDGLRAATPGKVNLSRNDLDRQMPNLFAGDLSSMTVTWLRDRRDGVVEQSSDTVQIPCASAGAF